MTHWLIILNAIISISLGQEVARPRIQRLGVRSEVQSRFATTEITSTILNPNPVPLEAEFTVILPNAAFINNFSMIVDNKQIIGEIKEKEKAKKQYEAAKSRGETAGLVAQKPRETNQFSTFVNVAANGKAQFTLTYQEVLQRVLGVYKHVINIAPGQIVEDMAIEVNIRESREITKLVVPKIEEKVGEKTNKELLKLKSDPGIKTWNLPLKDGVATAGASYVISEEKQKEYSGNGINGQLVVLYDVARSKDAGEIQAVDGYFVHFFAPSNIPVAPKHVVFTLDDSGSMTGEKIQQLKEAMRVILKDLNEGDYFNIVRFDDSASKWKEESVLSTENNIKKAIEFTDNLDAGGGTEIQESLRMSMQHLVDSKVGTNLPRMIVFLTDGIAYFSLDEVKKQNLKAESVIHAIAFGDDAEFTKLTSLAIQNDGVPRKVYTGADATLQLTGFYDEIASPLLLDVDIKYVNSTVDPESLIQNKKGTYYDGSEMMVVGKIIDSPTLFNKVDNSFLITGVVSCFDIDGPVKFDVRQPVSCSEFCFGPVSEEWGFVPSLRCPPSCPAKFLPAPLSDPRSVGGFIERMWAYLTIKKLLDEAKYKEDDTEKQESLKAKALKLSLKYNFVTELTSMVVTKPDGGEDEIAEQKSTDNAQEQDDLFAHSGFIGGGGGGGGGGGSGSGGGFGARGGGLPLGASRGRPPFPQLLAGGPPPRGLPGVPGPPPTQALPGPVSVKDKIDDVDSTDRNGGEVEIDEPAEIEPEITSTSQSNVTFMMAYPNLFNISKIEQPVEAHSWEECARLCLMKQGCSLAFFNPKVFDLKCQFGVDEMWTGVCDESFNSEFTYPMPTVLYCIKWG